MFWYEGKLIKVTDKFMANKNNRDIYMKHRDNRCIFRRICPVCKSKFEATRECQKYCSIDCRDKCKKQKRADRFLNILRMGEAFIIKNASLQNCFISLNSKRAI